MKPVHVAVGVVINPTGQVLIALRDTSRHQGGLWEFPGGKVEAKETVEQALHRELLEEVNIEALHSTPLLTIAHNYSDKTVLLDVWQVDQFSGTAKGCEGQAIKWISINNLENYDFPAANQEIITHLKASIL